MTESIYPSGEPDIVTSFEYNGGTYAVDWYDLQKDQPLPDLPWYQVYAIGNHEGKVPVVQYAEGHGNDNLPGGKVDPGETVEEALHREIEEELNMRITSWRPIGYQHVTHPSGKTTDELRVYAAMEKIDDFVNDPGGHIIGHRLVDIRRLNEAINYGLVGERIIQIVQREYGE